MLYSICYFVLRLCHEEKNPTVFHSQGGTFIGGGMTISYWSCIGSCLFYWHEKMNAKYCPNKEIIKNKALLVSQSESSFYYTIV